MELHAADPKPTTERTLSVIGPLKAAHQWMIVRINRQHGEGKGSVLEPVTAIVPDTGDVDPLTVR